MMLSCVKLLLLVFFLNLLVGTLSTDGSSDNHALITSEFDTPESILIVSLLNGNVEAIDVETGTLLWSIQTGDKLLDSSLSGAVKFDGSPVIPSLDGALFRLIGDSFEPLPFTAETLLTSTFRLSRDTTVVGGKELHTTAVSPATGSVYYRCDKKGCSRNIADPELSSQHVLIIKHVTHNVRATSLRRGTENWNLSVGQHDLRFMQATPPDHHNDGDGDHDHHSDGAEFCFDETLCSDDSSDDGLRFDTSAGLIVHSRVKHSSQATKTGWRHKVETPIAGAWTLHEGRLVQKDLLDPALLLRTQEKITAGRANGAAGGANGDAGWTAGSDRPAMFFGVFENQVYIQTSDSLQAKVRQIADAYKRGVRLYPSAMPRVRYAPYIQSSPSRTPWLNMNSEMVLKIDDKSGGALGGASGEASGEASDGASGDLTSSNALTVFHADREYRYPFDNGIYLFEARDVSAITTGIDKKVTSSSPVSQPSGSPDTEEGETFGLWDEEGSLFGVDVEKQIIIYVRSRSVKEALIIAVVSIITYAVVKRLLLKYRESLPTWISRFVDGASEIADSLVSPDATPIEAEPGDQPKHGDMTLTEVAEEPEPQAPVYHSRYETDFTMLACLGKGGFGVVFHAQNKLDECEYAIKRIALDPSEAARDRVMREVKALAKLDHPNIVRYFQAWFESPPPGWQEKRDEIWGSSESLMPTPANSATSIYSRHQRKRVKNHQHKLTGKPQSSNIVPQFKLEELSLGGLSSAGVSPFNQTNDSLDIIFGHSNDRTPTSMEPKPFCHYNKSTQPQSIGSSHSFSPNLSDIQTPRPSSKTDEMEGREGKEGGDRKPEFHKQRLFLYIQMQLCRKETLSEFLAANTLRRNQEDMYIIFKQICDAVEYIHSQGMIHRDLKPSNIFFSIDNTVKVGDFGLVAALSVYPQYGEAEETGSSKIPWSPSNEIVLTDNVGTHTYMSPEQKSGSPYDSKVDIYALGMVFFELMFPFSTYMERAKTLQDLRKLKMPERFIRELPTEHALVSQMLSPCPDNRPTISELLKHEILTDVSPPTPRKRTSSQRLISLSSNSEPSVSERSTDSQTNPDAVSGMSIGAADSQTNKDHDSDDDSPGSFFRSPLDTTPIESSDESEDWESGDEKTASDGTSWGIEEPSIDGNKR